MAEEDCMLIEERFFKRDISHTLHVLRKLKKINYLFKLSTNINFLYLLAVVYCNFNKNNFTIKFFFYILITV